MTEQQAYEVVRRHDDMELRRYMPHVVAEVTVGGAFEDAGNRAFRSLAAYISGANRGSRRVAMTAPVLQEPSTAAGEKVAMTAPVLQEPADNGGFAVAFVLPAALTLDTAPEPTDPAVSLRAVPERYAAVVRYSGRWSESAYARHREALERAVAAHGLTPVGEPRFARFNPPFTPWFLRRNEVVQDVEPPSPEAERS